MPWEPDMDTALRLTWYTAGLFFLVFLVSLVGELLGWWDLIGEIGMGLGATVSILLTLVGALVSASRNQVDAVGEEVQSVGNAVQSVGYGVQSVGENVQTVGENVQTVGENVQTVGENVQTVGENVRGVHYAVLANGVKLDKLDELDVIQANLDEQTGVLGEQLSVLTEMRDAM